MNALASPSRYGGDGRPRTALVHDWLNQDGGAEVVLAVLHDMYPEAPIYTTIADGTRVQAVRDWDVRPSWMDRLPAVHRRHQQYLPLYPLAWQRTRLNGYDLVLSNKSGFCHGVDKGRAVHVCYCLTPTRYVWEPDTYLQYESVPRGSRLLLRLLIPALRRWDRSAADRVDRFVAISSEVQHRIRRFYGRDSDVVYPPVHVDELPLGHGVGDDYVVLARLVPYKRIDLAVEAFNKLGRRLVIIGEGRDRARLESMAGPTIEFRGRLPRDEVADIVSRSRALIWPGVEDFGLAPVEAMAAGRPVVARRAGGVLDTVVEGVTGVFFDNASADELAAAVALVDAIAWRPEAIRAHAQRFGPNVFERELRRVVDETLRTATGEARRRAESDAVSEVKYRAEGYAASRAMRHETINVG